jgi:hypothetical protein
LIVFTTVGEASFACVALLTIEIGFNRAAVAGLHVGNARASAEDFHPEFVTRYARVRKEGHFAQVAPQIGAANSHAFYA